MFSFEENKTNEESDIFIEDDDAEIVEIEFDEIVSWLQRRLYLPEPIGPYINDLDKLKEEGRELVLKEEWWKEFCEKDQSCDNELSDQDVSICKVIFSEITKRENTILFKSNLFKIWRDLVNLYEEKRLFIAESAFSFVKLINYEIPFYEKKLEKNQKKIQTAEREIIKNEQSLKKSHSTYVKLFKKYKIEKIILEENEITSELKKSSIRELPKKVTNILNLLVTENSLLNDIINIYYSYFCKVSNRKTEKSKVCATIQNLMKLLDEEGFEVINEADEEEKKPESEEVEGEEEDENEENSTSSSKSHTFFEKHGERFYLDLLELQGFLRNSSELPRYDTSNIDRKVKVLNTLDQLFKDYEEIVFIISSSSFQKRITNSFSNIKVKMQIMESRIDGQRKRIAGLVEEYEEFKVKKEELLRMRDQKKRFLEAEILKCLEQTMKGKKMRIRITNRSNSENIL